ncbi:MAG TPA: peptidylprolyl isomerase [Polyangiaceae bacterium]|nr:peptidylprolyl isomerase [Polyangiaceae bacterium]
MDASHSEPARQERWWWLREPLLHFLLLGALVFVAHRLWQKHAPEQQVIVVTQALRADLERELRAELGRDPSPGERALALENWKSEEILYREGVRLGLDRDDPLVRRRVVEKMLDLERDLAMLRDPSDAELDAFLEQNLLRYSEPPRYDFEQVFVARSHGDALARAAVLERELAAGGSPEGKGDEFEAGRVLTGRSSENLRQLFGETFARRVPELELGRWQVVPSVHGVHVVRLTHVGARSTPDREQLRAKLVRDWKVAQRMSSGSILRAELASKYAFKESSK